MLIIRQAIASQFEIHDCRPEFRNGPGGSEAKREPTDAQVAGSHPSRGARNPTEACCGEGAMLPRVQLHVERSSGGRN